MIVFVLVGILHHVFTDTSTRIRLAAESFYHRKLLESFVLLKILSRPCGDIAAPGKPDILMPFGIRDDLFESIDDGNARAQISVRDDVHHRRIVRADFVAVIEFVFELIKEFVSRPFLLHAVVVDGVLVRDHHQQFIADPPGIRHLVIVIIAIV